MNQGLLRLFLWLNSAKVNACSLLELVAALTSAGMLICRCRFENPWLFSGKEHIINSASHTSLLNVCGKPTDGSLFWEVELKIRQKQIPCPSSCPSRHLTSGPAGELVLCCSISHVLSHSPWRFCRGLRCRPAFLGTHQPFPIRVGHWSNGVMVKSGALRRFFSAALLNESRKTSYALLVISTLLQLETVAMCGTCQACCKKKTKEAFWSALVVKYLVEDTVGHHMWDWCIRIVSGFTSLCSARIQCDDFLRRFLGLIASA